MRVSTVALLVVLGTSMSSAESAGGLRWTMPGGWKAQPERPMRAATYAVPPAPGDREPGECGVFFFGRGQGGSVADNFTRWSGQILGADGKPAPAAVGKRQVAGLTVNRIDVSGSYTGAGGPMASATRALPGYRLLGAIVEGPGGNNLFIKFTGPAKTVAANEKQFEQLIASLQVEK